MPNNKERQSAHDELPFGFKCLQSMERLKTTLVETKEVQEVRENQEQTMRVTFDTHELKRSLCACIVQRVQQLVLDYLMPKNLGKKGGILYKVISDSRLRSTVFSNISFCVRQQ